MRTNSWLDCEDNHGHVASTNHLSVHTVTLRTICIKKNRKQSSYFHVSQHTNTCGRSEQLVIDL